jgi:uncharacterized protein (TIGR02117 family)
MRWILRAVLWPVGIVLLWLAFSITLPLVPGPKTDITGTPTIKVGLISGLIHYDFLLPLRPDVLEHFAFSERANVPLRHPEAGYLVIGWGARDFYTTTGSYSNVSAKAVYTAITGDFSVMRVDVASEITPDLPVTWLMVSEAQFAALQSAILAGFERPNGAESPLDHPGFTETDMFYSGTGPFHAFRTCNVWVGEVLRASGVRFGVWTPAPWSVRLSLWWFGNG